MYLMCTHCQTIFKREFTLRCPADYFHNIVTLYCVVTEEEIINKMMHQVMYNNDSLAVWTIFLHQLSADQLIKIKNVFGDDL